MSKSVLCFFMLIIGISANSQISFKKGYIIKNSGEKIDCIILDEDWKNDITEFKYKLSENTELITANINSVKEFSIFDKAKYSRHTVEIDKSTEVINRLSKSKPPEFETKKLFLKVLLEGDASLYYYTNGTLRRYFYNTKENSEVRQLIYKSYLEVGTNKIAQNNRFRQQLLSDLKCQTITLEDVESLDYKKNKLINLFKDYNTCVNSEYVLYEGKKSKSDFNLTLRVGLNSSSLSIDHTLIKSRSTNFDNAQSFRFGFELEYVLPFNNNKWSLIAEPTYQSYNSKKEIAYINTPSVVRYANLEANYKSIEIPLGIRYYSYINKKSALFFNASFVLDFPIDAIVDVKEPEAENNNFNDLEFSPSPNLALGLGYKYNKIYSLELRYGFNREVMRRIAFYNTNYSTLSLIFGYSVF